MNFLQYELDALWKYILCSILAYLFYKLFITKKKRSYLEDLNIPFCPPPKLGVLYQFIYKINFHEQEVEFYEKYGRIYGTVDKGSDKISIGEPELLRKILVKDFNSFNIRRDFETGNTVVDSLLVLSKGEKWKRIRTIVSPTFSTGRIKGMADIIIGSANTLVENFAKNCGKPINGKEYFNTFTMDVIASTAFGTKLKSFEDPDSEFSQAAKSVFGGKFSWELVLFFLLPSVAKIFKIGIFPRKPIQFFKDLMLDIIKKRRQSGKVYKDFLQLLFNAEKEEKIEKEDKKTIDDKNAEELGHDGENENIFKVSKIEKTLSEDEMLAQCVLFLAAGFDTTSSAVTMASYLLSRHPEAQEKLREEVDSVIHEHGGKVTYEATQEMKYLDHVVSETLRMYPPLVRLDRTASSDYELEGTGITIKKGTMVTVPVYAMHHDAEFYPQPEKFKPERFTAEEKAKRHPYTYLAFGAGPRNCVAMRFALMEVKLCLACIISKLKLLPCPEDEDHPTLESTRGILQPNIRFKVEQRNNTIYKDG